MKQLLKRLFLAINPSNKVVLLDYPIEPKSTYPISKPHQGLAKLVRDGEDRYKELLEYSLQFRENFFSIKDSREENNPVNPTWNNGYVPGLDIIILYTILNYLKPKSYIEIGSGTTTKTVNKARVENNLDVEITCIDPNPRQEIEKIADSWAPSYIQDFPLDKFKGLQENDVVFFDGTHTLYPNSDVMWFFLEILPILPKGVVVQVHDIYLPFDYPKFMLDRYYSEIYILGALILSNPDKYEILAPNFYISETNHLSSVIDDIFKNSNLKNVEKHGGSFWFKVK